MDLEVIFQLTPEQLRQVLPGFLAGYVDGDQASAATRARISAMVNAWSEADLQSVLDTLSDLGNAHQVYRAHPLCREVSRVWCQEVVLDPKVTGVENLASAMAHGPTVILCNHRSYIDSTATDAVLAWSGRTDLADRLLAVAGPKVYQDLFRRVAAASLNTLPAPQSTNLGYTAKLTKRELASRALESMESARSALLEGLVLLLYPEGSRSRSGRMGPFIKGVHRYLGLPELSVVPTAILGTDSLMPLGRTSVVPSQITVSFGQPIRVDDSDGTREALRATHRAIAELLPPDQKPVEGEPVLL